MQRVIVGLAAFVLVYACLARAAAQEVHLHTPGMSGVPQGVPRFCASATVSSVTTGAWSDPKTWSTARVPDTNDKVVIAAGHSVTYDAVSDRALDCIEITGTLRFATSSNTRLK